MPSPPGEPGPDGSDTTEPGFIQIDAGDTIWRFDEAFLTSNWTCIWGRGCLGILDHPAEDLGQGCCSVGANLDGLDEARMVGAMAAMIPDELFQHHAEASAGGVYQEDHTNTRVVDDACIFLNRPGFPGGAGCALHLAALDAGESPIDWKPSVCWQLPVMVDWEPGPDPDTEIATMRRWTRKDWGEIGDEMAWCCTEGDRAYVGDRRVIESLADELEGIVGSEVFVELRHRIDADS